MNKYLHIAYPDKFTLPLCQFIIGNEDLKKNHKFLFISDKKQIYNHDIVSTFKTPIFKNLLTNLFLFLKLCYSSNVIIMHGGSPIVLFKIFPWCSKKLVWVINGAELYNLTRVNKTKNNSSCVLKRAKVHLTHIEGDSILANEILGSNAVFHYSPIYLSNVVSTNDFSSTKIHNKVKILVGNSNSSNNDHHTIFKKLKKFENDIEYIISPLSYGNDIAYKQSVKQEGFRLFGNKFKPVEDFLSMDQYKELLKDIDIAVFNHWRQEAMGVTLTLMSLGKIVYINANTTSYRSLYDRGFRIYNNNLLFNEGPKIQRNVLENKYLLEKYYSKEILIESLQSIKLQS